VGTVEKRDVSVVVQPEAGPGLFLRPGKSVFRV